MGTSLRTLSMKSAEESPNNRKFKAVSTGGLPDGCIPLQFLDTLTDYEAIVKAGAIMGSGGMIVMDETTCWWTWQVLHRFLPGESCGQVHPLQGRDQRLLHILERITEGQGKIVGPGRAPGTLRIIRRPPCAVWARPPKPGALHAAVFPPQYRRPTSSQTLRGRVCGGSFSQMPSMPAPSARTCQGICPW